KLQKSETEHFSISLYYSALEPNKLVVINTASNHSNGGIVHILRLYVY
ncbi:MAG: hypothetical protein ACJAS1_004440, partial [Oleiphilaceae bacterium]